MIHLYWITSIDMKLITKSIGYVTHSLNSVITFDYRAIKSDITSQSNETCYARGNVK